MYNLSLYFQTVHIHYIYNVPDSYVGPIEEEVKTVAEEEGGGGGGGLLVSFRNYLFYVSSKNSL